ncbi:hypothetical protein CEK29_06135 [Bordetella genomosp. 5]|uniref:hypothetical protein n=1 Tax=Bordetella genomosp. 5 TaxID=1395608 RepID=UPI000B9E4A84|nr:hypothetical protein [Bordetella genomosp. 5]OZI45397.1 hypothetical protein CEK29_06135 [Bordetella genomosp. 5]
MSVDARRIPGVLRIPVHQPVLARALRSLAAALGAGMAAVAGTLAAGMADGLVWLAGIALAGLGGGLGWAGVPKRSASPRALSAGPAADGWRVRRQRHWHRATLRRARLAPAHVRLDLELDATAFCVTNSKITCTVWRSGLPPEQWRRLRVLARAADRSAVPRRGAS